MAKPLTTDFLKPALTAVVALGGVLCALDMAGLSLSRSLSLPDGWTAAAALGAFAALTLPLARRPVGWLLGASALLLSAVLLQGPLVALAQHALPAQDTTSALRSNIGLIAFFSGVSALCAALGVYSSRWETLRRVAVSGVGYLCFLAAYGSLLGSADGSRGGLPLFTWVALSLGVIHALLPRDESAFEGSAGHNDWWRGCVIAAMGATSAVLAGWLVQNASIVQGGTHFVPMQFNTALAMLLLATGMYSAGRHRPVHAVLLVILPVALALASIAEELNWIEGSIDQSLFTHRITSEAVPPGRQALSTAVAVLLLSTAAILQGLPKLPTGAGLLAWAGGLLALTIGVLSLTGYTLGLPLVRAWGASTPMAFNSACIASLLGLAAMLRGLHMQRAYAVRATLVPLFAAVVVAVATAQLWYVLMRTDESQRSERDADLLLRAGLNFSRELSDRAELINMAARAVAQSAQPPQASLDFATDPMWDRFPALQALIWIDAQGKVTARSQRPGGEPRVLDALLSAYSDATWQRGDLHVFDDKLAAFDGQTPQGHLLAAFDLEQMQNIIIRYSGLEGLVRARAERTPQAADGANSRIQVLGTFWHLSTLQGVSPLTAGRGREPSLVMLGGLFVAGLLAMALRFALQARGRALEVSQHSAELRTRNALLQHLSAGLDTAAIPQLLMPPLTQLWPDASIALLMDSNLLTHAWPPTLDAGALLRQLAHDGEKAQQALDQLHGWTDPRRYSVQCERVRDRDGEACGVYVLLRPREVASAGDAALLRTAAAVSQLSLVRHAEQMELRDLHHTYESLVAFHPDPVLELNRHGYVCSANAAAQSLFDTRAALTGVRLTQLLDPAQQSVVELRLQAVLRGLPQSAELRAMTPRGAREMELTLVPVRHRDEVNGAFAMLHDVTRLRSADRALRQSHERAQLFSRRLIALNECAVALAESADRDAAARALVESLRQTIDVAAVAIRLVPQRLDDEMTAASEFTVAVAEGGPAPPSVAQHWADLLGGGRQALALDRAGLEQRLPATCRPRPEDLPQQNWIVIPMRGSDGSVLGRLEVFDARAEDDLEDAFTIATQFAQMGAASLQRLDLIGGIRAAERHLTQQLAFTEAIAGSIGDAVYAVDRSGRLNYLNPAAERMLGWKLHDADAGAFEAALIGSNERGLAQRALADNAVLQAFDVELQRRDGSFFPASCSASPLYLDGSVVGAVVVVRDVSERLRAETLQRERDRFFELSVELFCIADTQGNFHQVNDAFSRTLGYSQAELVNRPWSGLLHPDDRALTQAAADILYASGHITDLINRYRHADGSYRWLEWSAHLDRNGNVYAAARDITERRRIEGELSHHATHDALTGLPNLAQQHSFLQGALAVAAERAGRVTVFYIDIDHFHATNETRGHAAGDSALREVAARLRDAAGPNGQVSRIAGDEFVLVRVEESDWADQAELGEHLLARVEEPMLLDGEQFFLTCSIGVSCFPENGATSVDLIRQAEAAMLRAKGEGRNTVVAFSNDQLQVLQDRQRLGARLRNAIRDGELVLHYQPTISVHDWQVAGVEALVRWQSPEMGLLLPGRFIQVAEEMGMIVEIGQWVLEHACRQAKEWLDGGLADFSVAVNVSGLQLQRPDFLERVRRALDSSGLPPRYLELELTESIIMEHVERVIGTMRALKALGVMLSLDDFGSGYSSLSYLRRFPLDKLKIDQAFVHDITNDANAAGICRAIIALGHQLGFTVSAEGVESIGQAGFLRRAECDQFQGNYFSPPLPAAQTFEVLRRRYVQSERLAPIIEEQRAPRTILLVDDEENVLRALVRLLRRDSYEILTATRPRDAMELLASQPVQVILSDQRMPEQSGTQFLSQVKDMYPDTVRLILSGYSDLASLTDAINRGAVYRYIAKPWDDEDLRRQIREAFRLHEHSVTARTG